MTGETNNLILNTIEYDSILVLNKTQKKRNDAFIYYPIIMSKKLK